MSDLNVPGDRFENPAHIELRVEAAPESARGSLRTALRFLYELDGPINLPADRFKAAFPHLDDAERVVARWLTTRTNGKLRKTYGADALRAARQARYRCEHCGFSDVRTLNLDHVSGRVPGTAFACLCANCHAIKSRKFDWSGKKREAEL